MFEYYAEVPSAFKAFAMYKDAANIKVAQCPSTGRLSYARIMENYIMNTFKGVVCKYPWTTCLAAKTFVSDMEKLEVWDEYMRMESDIDVSHPFLKSSGYIETVVANNKTALSFVSQLFDRNAAFCVKDGLHPFLSGHVCCFRL